MTPQTERNRALALQLALVAIIGLAVIFVYLLLTSLPVSKTTGLVTIDTFATDSVITISQNERTAAVVGTGSAKLRLLPGVYLVSAKSNGQTGNARVTVHKQVASIVNITQGTVVDSVPTPDTINFLGTDAFIARGLTVDQVSNLKTLFFKYKKSASKITIDKNSLERGERNPGSGDPFVMNFTGKIDGTAYKATITYTDTENLELTLFNSQTGDQIFDQSSVQTATNN